MAKKNAKLTICDIRSIQAKVKWSILIFAAQVENITLISEGGGRIMQVFSLLIPKGRYFERSAQD